MPWIAVDFDGTLAHGHDIYKPGAPIALMVDRVKTWLAAGREVRIFTARVGTVTEDECLGALDEVDVTMWSAAGLKPPKEWAPVPSAQQQWYAYQRGLVEAWCQEHLGQKLPVTSEKDLHCVQIWDDIAIQVLTNTGQAVFYEGL